MAATEQPEAVEPVGNLALDAVIRKLNADHRALARVRERLNDDPDLGTLRQSATELDSLQASFLNRANEVSEVSSENLSKEAKGELRKHKQRIGNKCSKFAKETNGLYRRVLAQIEARVAEEEAAAERAARAKPDPAPAEAAAAEPAAAATAEAATEPQPAAGAAATGTTQKTTVRKSERKMTRRDWVIVALLLLLVLVLIAYSSRGNGSSTTGVVTQTVTSTATTTAPPPATTGSTSGVTPTNATRRARTRGFIEAIAGHYEIAHVIGPVGKTVDFSVNHGVLYPAQVTFGDSTAMCKPVPDGASHNVSIVLNGSKQNICYHISPTTSVTSVTMTKYFEGSPDSWQFPVQKPHKGFG